MDVTLLETIPETKKSTCTFTFDGVDSATLGFFSKGIVDNNPPFRCLQGQAGGPSSLSDDVEGDVVISNNEGVLYTLTCYHSTKAWFWRSRTGKIGSYDILETTPRLYLNKFEEILTEPSRLMTVLRLVTFSKAKSVDPEKAKSWCTELMEDKAKFLESVKQAAQEEIQKSVAREASDGEFFDVPL